VAAVHARLDSLPTLPQTFTTCNPQLAICNPQSSRPSPRPSSLIALPRPIHTGPESESIRVCQPHSTAANTRPRCQHHNTTNAVLRLSCATSGECSPLPRGLLQHPSAAGPWLPPPCYPCPVVAHSVTQFTPAPNACQIQPSPGPSSCSCTQCHLACNAPGEHTPTLVTDLVDLVLAHGHLLSYGSFMRLCLLTTGSFRAWATPMAEQSWTASCRNFLSNYLQEAIASLLSPNHHSQCPNHAALACCIGLR
jgi:hypothetical protein